MNVDAKMEVGVEDHGGKAAPSPSAAASAPPHFLCPVSMELMKDPVMVATGHTYDRPSIKRWLEQGHKTCPVTGSRLRNLDLLPNFALRSAISEWAAANNVKLNDRQLTSVTEKAVGGTDGESDAQTSPHCVLEGHEEIVWAVEATDGHLFSASADKSISGPFVTAPAIPPVMVITAIRPMK